MTLSRRPVTVLASCLVAALALSGCTQQQKTTSTPAPQPAPQAAKEPAPPTSYRGWPTRRSDEITGWHALAYPTGEARTSVVGIEKGFPREVRLDKPFDYEIVVKNLTNMELVDVAVGEEPGSNMQITSSDPTATVDDSAGIHLWNLGAMGPGEVRVIRVNAEAVSEGSIASCAWVRYNSQICATAPVVAPKLMVTKSGPAEVLKCDEIKYDFVVTNPGTGFVADVVLTDRLPAGLTTKDGKDTITIDVGTVTAGQSKPFSATVIANRAGRFDNKASVAGEFGLTAESAAVTTVVRQPVLTITKSCKAKEYINRPISAEITVANTGDGVARDAVIEDTLPAGAEFVSASDGGSLVGNKVVWQVGTMQPGGNKKVSLVYKTSNAGNLRNTASARAYCADVVTDDCITEVTGIPAILLEVVDLEDPDLVGTDEIYVVTVTNQGSAPATNVRITCTLEDNQRFVSAEGASEGTNRGQTITFAPVASIPAKQKATFRVTVRNVKAGDVRFTTVMTSDQLTRPVEETEATNVYE